MLFTVQHIHVAYSQYWQFSVTKWREIHIEAEKEIHWVPQLRDVLCTWKNTQAKKVSKKVFRSLQSHAYCSLSFAFYIFYKWALSMSTELSQANIWEEIKGRQLMMLCQLYSHTAQNGKIQEKKAQVWVSSFLHPHTSLSWSALAISDR